MNTFFEIFLISISLALDSLAVSIAGGAQAQKSKIIHAVKVAAFFGVFQAAMPLLGWLIGEMLKDEIVAIDHWVAFVLLAGIGIKMIHESVTASPNDKKRNLLNTKTLIMLSIATSIDAFVVGITLGLLTIPLLLSISIIGIVTFILCFFGFLFGNRLGKLFGKRIEILGGLVLIAIGIKILLSHLTQYFS